MLSSPLLCLIAALPAAVQTAEPSSDEARARPERPTVATHAVAVARGHLEIETGLTAAHRPDRRLAATALAKIGFGSGVHIALAATRQAQDAAASTEPLFAGVKWQIVAAREGRPLLALLPGVTVTRQAAGGRDAAVSLLGIVTQTFGPLGVDINLAATRLNDAGGSVPYLWAVAAAAPAWRSVGWGVELSGERPAGGRGTTYALGFLSVTPHPGLVFDVGWTAAIRGADDGAVIAGLTWNAGRVWR